MTETQVPAGTGTSVGAAILKTTPEDFLVSEIAALPPAAAGQEPATHTYLTVTKSGLSTFDMAAKLATVLDLPSDDVDWLGLKDEDGITTQVFSARRLLGPQDLRDLTPALDAAVSPHTATLDGIVGQGTRSLTRRTLIGNTFRIAVRGLDPDEVETIAVNLADSRTVPFLNYYDSQRFGVIGSDVLNTHEIGDAIQRGDHVSAYEGFLRSGNPEPVKQALRDAYAKSGHHGRAMLSVGRRLTQFMVDAAASYRWNAALSAHLAASGSTERIDAIPGLQQLHFGGLDDRSLPIVVTAPGGRVVDEDGDSDGWIVEDQPFRRASVQQAYLMEADAVTEDDGTRSLRLAFYLPRGCYATMFVRYVLWLGLHR